MKLFASERIHFPDPRQAQSEGLVAMGDHLSSELLLEAYSFGIFPWPHKDSPVLWFCPEERGVLDFKDLHVPRSLAKFQRQTEYRVTFNRAFEDVIKQCARVHRPGQTETWITEGMRSHYLQFHKQGYAHSVECWMGDELAGGLYGVYVGGVFAGESMFFRRSNASKLCLLALIEVLKENGLNWMDVQMVTDVLGSLGAKYIHRDQYLRRLESAKAQARPLTLPDAAATDCFADPNPVPLP